MNEKSDFEKRLDTAIVCVVTDPVVEERIKIYSRTVDQSKTSVFWDEEEKCVEFEDDKVSIVFYQK